jgi:hypothetical protein
MIDYFMLTRKSSIDMNQYSETRLTINLRAASLAFRSWHGRRRLRAYRRSLEWKTVFG